MNIIKHIIKKEFLQFKRDPKMFAILLVAPVFQLLLLGYAATLDVKQVYLSVFDMDKTEQSRMLIEHLNENYYIQVNAYSEDYNDIEYLIDNRKINAAVIIEPNFERHIETNNTANIQVIFDGSDGNFASIASGYVNGVIQEFSKNIMLEKLNRTGNKNLPAEFISGETRIWYNPEMETRIFMVPGIVGLLLMIVTLLLTSLAIVKEKEIGTMEQLIVTPIKPYQLMAGKLIPFMLVGILSTIIVLTAMNVIFGIAVKGSILFLFWATFVYLISLLGFGLFISTISQTQQQAMMLSIFAVMLPMVYLSGFAFPIENMPKIIQYVTYIIPLRYFITIIRGVILKGLGFEQLWPQLTALIAMGIIILTAASLRFKKNID